MTCERSLRRALTALTALSGIVAGTLLAAGPAWSDPAPTTWYRVDLVVFSRLAPDAGSHETWPANPGRPDLAGAVALVPPPGGVPAPGTDGTVVTPLAPVPYQQLPAAKDRLDGVVRTLNASHRYRVLLHLAWREPGLPPAQSRAVRIELPDGVLEGTVRLTRSRYLHVALDLLYRPGGTPAPTGPQGSSAQAPAAGNSGDSGSTAAPDTGATAYRMRQHRRIDPGVLNYFDHPMFGVLLEATPIDVPGEGLQSTPVPAAPDPGTGGSQ